VASNLTRIWCIVWGVRRERLASPAFELVHPSERRVQYTSFSFGKRLEDEGISSSIGRIGSAYGNALAESFVATVKTELLYRSQRGPILMFGPL
jgi:transposase InsO family protein